MSRLAAPEAAAMSTRQREIAGAIAAGPRGGVRGPLAVWLHSPELADRAQALGRVCRYETSLPARLSELAILVVATIWGSEYEWYAHKPLALAAGLTPTIVDALRDRRPPAFEVADEALVHDVVATLHCARRLDDALYARAVALLGEVGLVELIGIAGYYTLISMTINVFEIGLPEGVRHELGPDATADGTGGSP